jgi:hypothetical protein
MAENAENYLRKAREFAEKAREATNPFATKAYSKLARDYELLAWHATQMSDNDLEAMVERMVAHPRQPEVRPER